MSRVPSLASRVAEAGAVRHVLEDREALLLFASETMRDAREYVSVAVLATTSEIWTISLPERVDERMVGRLIALASAGVDVEPLTRRLGATLLDPVLAALPSRVDRLVVVDEGALLRLPFGALRLADGRRGDEHVRFSFVQAAADLARARRSARWSGRTPRAAIVALGDPDVQRHRVASAGISSPGVRGVEGKSGDALPRLRHSSDEARSAASVGRRSRALVGGAATEGALREWAPAAAVVHLATHRVTIASGYSALVLTPSSGDDGLFTPRELGALPIAGALVVLSACGTLTEGISPRSDDFVAQALAGGAAAVVATRWPVSDRETAVLMERFYAHLARGHAAAAALNGATRETRLSGGSIREWGAFALVGDGEWVMPAAVRRGSAASRLARQGPM